MPAQDDFRLSQMVGESLNIISAPFVRVKCEIIGRILSIY
jgi:hypothetical protein